MLFRTKNDISYFKFLELSEAIEGKTDDVYLILSEAKNIFKPKSLTLFARALETDGRLNNCFKLDLQFKAGRFIDADTYKSDGDVLNMLKSILVPRRNWFGRKYKVEDISLREAEDVLKKWDTFLSELKYRYEYVYNPPVRLRAGGDTQGSIERQEFAEHYGGYAEMTYLVSKGVVGDHKKIWEWDLDYFLFWGEYLLRKRDVENLK